MQLIKRFIDDNENLELLSTAKNVEHAEAFYDVAGHAQEFLSVVGEDDLELPTCVLAPKSTLGQLGVEEVEVLRRVYSKMYGHVFTDDHTMLTTFKNFSYLLWKGKQLTSICFKGSHHVPYVYANYGSVDDEPLDLRPAKVLYYMQHHIMLESSQPNVFAVVCWPQIHPSRGKNRKTS